jgi:formylglycine-generating enzyme
MRRTLTIVVGLVLLSTLVGFQDATAPPPKEQPRIPGCVPAPDSRIDPAKGLPTRIIHQASGIVLVLIPAGEFRMGSPENDPDRSKSEQQHRRVIRRAFYLGETEVTVGQFRKFVQATKYQTDAERGTPTGGHGKGSFASTTKGDRQWHADASWHQPFPTLPEYCLQDDHPVCQVSWNDAQRFCEHFKLRLPTEAQWEYACRAGSQTRFPWGEAEVGGAGFANVADASRKRRFPAENLPFPFDDGVALLAPVGKYKPNTWGLYDMIGNLEEWCEDTHGKYSADGADETAAIGDENTARVLRGGSWVANPTVARSATRIGMLSMARRDFHGFRVALLPG